MKSWKRGSAWQTLSCRNVHVFLCEDIFNLSQFPLPSLSTVTTERRREQKGWLRYWHLRHILSTRGIWIAPHPPSPGGQMREILVAGGCWASRRRMVETKYWTRTLRNVITEAIASSTSSPSFSVVIVGLVCRGSSGDGNLHIANIWTW